MKKLIRKNAVRLTIALTGLFILVACDTIDDDEAYNIGYTIGSAIRD